MDYFAACAAAPSRSPAATSLSTERIKWRCLLCDAKVLLLLLSDALIMLLRVVLKAISGTLVVAAVCDWVLGVRFSVPAFTLPAILS